MFKMSYFYPPLASDFIQCVHRTQGALDVVSPNFFHISNNGLLLVDSNLTPLIGWLHRKGLKVVPFLSNHWNRDLGRLMLRKRATVAKQIAAAIQDLQLDGVNIDIENLIMEDQKHFTDFVRLVRQHLPRGKEVSVAVAANPFGWTKGWHGSYNYRELANHADYLMLMTYNENQSINSPGPVASLDWVKKSIQYALDQGVPSNQLVLGLPCYGRCWGKGQSDYVEEIPLHLVAPLMKQYNGEIGFDQNSQCPKAVFTIDSRQALPSVHGKTLPPGTYTLWFENEQSLKEKIKLVRTYHLKGIGMWSLGQEEPSLWSNVFKDK